MAITHEEFWEDSAFVAALQAGNEEAWEKFVNHYSVKLRAYLSYRLPTAESVDDVLSEIFIGTVQAIKQFANDVKLSTFVYSIAHRKVADYWRRQTTTVALADVTHAASRESLAQLPQEIQQALLLRYYVGLSVAEIAQALGRTVKATESLLQRARQQFSEEIEMLSATLTTAAKADHDAPKKTAVFGSVYPLLLLQKQLNQQNGMAEEAQIFERAQQQVEQMATKTPAERFSEMLFLLQASAAQDVLVQLLPQWLERHPNYDTSEQL